MNRLFKCILFQICNFSQNLPLLSNEGSCIDKLDRTQEKRFFRIGFFKFELFEFKYVKVLRFAQPGTLEIDLIKILQLWDSEISLLIFNFFRKSKLRISINSAWKHTQKPHFNSEHFLFQLSCITHKMFNSPINEH